uniref:Uncharacterized protein n=1 Tax=Rhizophora mucronata TaxID=61149 RepID=A0A2P2PU04_RHIMU
MTLETAALSSKTITGRKKTWQEMVSILHVRNNTTLKSMQVPKHISEAKS